MEPKKIADVSVICANFNNGRYLEACIDSVANGTVWPKEMIIVDDGSTDNSADILKRKAEQYSWVKPFFLTENQGVANASNSGLKAASGKYLMRLDSDDMVAADRIEKQFDFLESNPGIDVYAGNCCYIDSETDQPIRSSNFPTSSSDIERLFQKGENGVLNGTTMFKRKWFDLFQYRQEMVWAEDYDFFAHLLHAGARFAASAQENTLVRIHRSSTTSNLTFDTLEKAWLISRELFGNSTPLWRVRQNFYHTLLYRKALLSTGSASRLALMAASAAFRPDKVIKRWRRPAMKASRPA
jgi:glycosyltransferase involved in cell wall biosynthesis